jgi:hypothetical protein
LCGQRSVLYFGNNSFINKNEINKKARIMKKVAIVLLLFLSFVSLVSAQCNQINPCCCQTEQGSGQKKCYVDGWCCNIGHPVREYWDQISCYSFNVYVFGPATLIVGNPTFVNLNIENSGGLADSYSISYVVDSPNPTQILVNLDRTEVGPVAPGQTEMLQPKVTLLFAGARGDIIFYVRSKNAGEKTATYTILQSDMFTSLPEFNSAILFLLVGVSTFIFYRRAK